MFRSRKFLDGKEYTGIGSRNWDTSLEKFGKDTAACSGITGGQG